MREQFPSKDKDEYRAPLLDCADRKEPANSLDPSRLLKRTGMSGPPVAACLRSSTDSPKETLTCIL